MAELTIEGDRLAFPGICPVCQMSAARIYPYTKRQITQRITFPIAYCDRHSDLLTRSDRMLGWIRLAIIILAIGLWALVAYGAILTYPGLKLIPGDTLIGWGASILLIMFVLGIIPLVGGGAVLIRIALHAFPGLVRGVFESRDAKAARRAIEVRDFKLRSTSLAGGPAQLQWVIFRIIDPHFARELQKVNAGSRLVE